MDLARRIDRVRRRLRALVLRSRLEREMDEEMRFHLEMEIEDRVRRGMAPEEARRTALRDFGRVQAHKEDAREAWGLRLWDELVQDVRFGARMLARRPLFAAVAVLTLAVGIGATTAVFGLANWLLLRPVPGVEAPGELVLVRFQREPGRSTGISFANHADLREAAPAFSGLAAFTHTSLQGSAEGVPALDLRGETVAGDYFGVLGVRPQRGRFFQPEELGAAGDGRVAVISDALWRSLFAGSADAVGGSLRLNGHLVTVVGVAPRGFRGVQRLGETDVWLPPSAYRLMRHDDAYGVEERGRGIFQQLVGRLRPGATPAVAEEQLRRAMQPLVQRFPEENGIYSEYLPTVFPGIGLPVLMREHLAETMRLLLGIVALVLLIACANVANLLLFRGVHRRSEMAMRRALGASAGRILRQHVAEGTLLSLLGAAAGVAVAFAVTRYFEGQAFPGLPPVEDVGVDGRVLGFALLLSLATGPLFGALPALAAWRQDFLAGIRGAARTETGMGARVRGAFTVVQIAGSLVLLVGALLLTRTLQNLNRVEVGFDADGVVAFVLDPDPQGYSEDRVRALRRRIVDGAGGLPGVHAVSLSSSAPFGGAFHLLRLLSADAPEEAPLQPYTFYVSPDYFRTLGIPLLAGRSFLPREVEATAEAAREGPIILSRATAERLFGTADAVGRRVVEDGYRERRTHTVVGVVEDTRTHDLRSVPDPVAYRPVAAAWHPAMWILVRAALPRARTEAAVREVVAGIDPALPFYRVETLGEGIQRRLAEERLFARILRLLAVLATGLAAVGLYGVVSYSVAQRTREIGIRIALGARAGAVVALVARQSGLLVAVGTLAGWGGAVALSRLLRSRLFGVEPLDPAVYALAAALLVLVALAASTLPARAATRVDPVRALKSE